MSCQAFLHICSQLTWLCVPIPVAPHHSQCLSNRGPLSMQCLRHSFHQMERRRVRQGKKGEEEEGAVFLLHQRQHHCHASFRHRKTTRKIVTQHRLKKKKNNQQQLLLLQQTCIHRLGHRFYLHQA